MAAPTAGTCEVATPATILATAPGLPLRLEAVASHRPSALGQHVGVVLLAHAGHFGGDLLEGQAIGRAELGGEVDVAAELDHAIPVAIENRLFLVRAHRETIEIARLVSLERLPILGLHQGHAELVQPIPLTRPLGVENSRARDV